MIALVASPFVYIYRLKHYGSGPVAVCRVASIAHGLNLGEIMVELQVEPRGIWGWELYTGDVRGGRDRVGLPRSSISQESMMRSQVVAFGLRSTDSSSIDWQKNYATRESLKGQYGEQVGLDSAADWHTVVPLVEKGRTYTVTPERPLLVGRATRYDGTMGYWWFSVRATKEKERKPEPTRYWPIRAVCEEPDTIKARIAWTGEQRPSEAELKCKLAPYYRVVDESRLRDIRAQVSLTAKSASGQDRALDVTIRFTDVPTGYEDVIARCNLAGGTAAHPPVEVPIRRRRFHGEIYPLGVVKTVRASGRRGTYDMIDFRIFPQFGTIIGYGSSKLYRIDAKTLARDLLWQAPVGDPERPSDPPRVTACALSLDGKLLAFAIEPGRNAPRNERHRVVQFLDMGTRQIVTSVRIGSGPPVTRLEFDSTGKHLCVVSAGNGYGPPAPLFHWIDVLGGQVVNSATADYAHSSNACMASRSTTMPADVAVSADAGLAIIGLPCGCLVSVDALGNYFIFA